MALITLTATVSISSIRIARERDRANCEAETSRRIAGFIINLFRVSDPSEARGNAVTAREILDRGARQIESSLSGEPEVQTSLMATMGDAYTGLAIYSSAWQRKRP
jgi:hypothetical protein